MEQYSGKENNRSICQKYAPVLQGNFVDTSSVLCAFGSANTTSSKTRKVTTKE
jgi:hypothetical protein